MFWGSCSAWRANAFEWSTMAEFVTRLVVSIYSLDSDTASDSSIQYRIALLPGPRPCRPSSVLDNHDILLQPLNVFLE
ncbi:hypothetical protein DL95DRAFT_397616 [Leptodontidium sp. 2 PMI_412]|nr:hypothetical protein DL95DRAFT_397616 [Leptodontidium sp. 2 PMI_412]